MSLTLSRLGAQYALDIVTGRSGGQGLRSTYLGLLTSAPLDSYSTSQAAALETTMTGYSRLLVSWVAPSAVDPSETHNGAVLTFGPFSGTLQTVTHFALFSSASGTTGDFLAWGAAASSVTPTSGQSVQVGIGNLSMSIIPA